MGYKAWYTMDVEPKAYYAQVAKAALGAGKANARTRVTAETVPGEARAALSLVAPGVQDAFHEHGAPMPPLMEGCTVAVLGSGTGRDACLAALLAGPEGRVIAVEPVPELLERTRAAVAEQQEREGARMAPVEFVDAAPERMDAVADGTVDIVVSNCTFNLSPDKEAYAREVLRILVQDGEWYFCDVFTGRRIPLSLAKDADRRADRLAGAMFVGDFRRLVQAVGFNDPRYLMHNRTPLADGERAAYGDVEFATLTVRALKSSWTEDVCESYGETVAYDGSLPDYPDFFLFEHNIKFPAGKACQVCGNVSGLAAHSRYAKVFEVTGDRSVHIGDTHRAYDDLVVNAPEFE